MNINDYTIYLVSSALAAGAQITISLSRLRFDVNFYKLSAKEGDNI